MKTELAEYLGEDCYVKLIQKVINPSFQTDSSCPQEQDFIDKLHKFFDDIPNGKCAVSIKYNVYSYSWPLRSI